MSSPTPEQLRETLIELYVSIARTFYFEGSYEEYERNLPAREFADQILALFATFLASIELPESKEAKAPYTIMELEKAFQNGRTKGLEESQAIIDKIVEELK